MVLQKILAGPNPPKSMTVLVRSPSKGKQLETELSLPSGTTIKAIQGSIEEYDKLEKLASEHDYIIATVPDMIETTQALLKGMKSRKERIGHRVVYLHTSGTGVLVDDAKGEYADDKIYTDLHPTPATKDSPALISIDKVPDTAQHRDSDIAITAADAAGDLKSYIILPGTIWGEGKGEIYSKGISNNLSQQMPNLAKIGLDRGQAGMIGKGANIWPHVNIADTGDLFALIYTKVVNGEKIGHGKEGYYFATSGEYTLLAAAQAIGQSLVENKWAKESNPTKLSKEEIDKYYNGSEFGGSNSRGRADRSKSIGWRPKYTDERDFLRDVREEVVRVEKKFGKEWKGNQ